MGGHAFRKVAPKILPRATQDAKFLPPRLVWTVGGRIICEQKKANQRTRPYKHFPAAFSTSSVDEFLHSSRPTLDSKTPHTCNNSCDATSVRIFESSHEGSYHFCPEGKSSHHRLQKAKPGQKKVHAFARLSQGVYFFLSGLVGQDLKSGDTSRLALPWVGILA